MVKIISAFPCMGKTHCSKNNDRVLDLESSDTFLKRKVLRIYPMRNLKV